MAIVAPLIKANRHYAMVLILEEQKHRVVHTSRCEDAKRWRLHGTAAAAVKLLTQSGATIVYSHQPCNSQFSSKLESRLVGVWTELWRLLLSWFFSLFLSPRICQDCFIPTDHCTQLLYQNCRCALKY